MEGKRKTLIKIKADKKPHVYTYIHKNQKKKEKKKNERKKGR